MFTCNYLALIILLSHAVFIGLVRSLIWLQMYDMIGMCHCMCLHFVIVSCIVFANFFFFFMYCLLSLYLLSDAFSVPSITSAENMFK